MKRNAFKCVVFLFCAVILACGSKGKEVQEVPKVQESKKSQTAEKEKVVEKTSETVVTVSGLKYEDIVVGTGEEAKSGRTVEVHYTGWLTNGTKFDSSKDRGQPFSFPLGAGRVIKGWDEGVAGMKVGGKRKLTIPSELGYGSRGAGGAIPPNATLIFEVELLALR